MRATGQASIDSFEFALATFRAGDRARAAAQCGEILGVTPRHPGANHLLGVIHLLSGDSVKAESLILASLSETKSVAGEADLGLALKAQKRYGEAEDAQRRALAINPGFAIAHHNLARIYEEQGNVAEAETAYRRAVALDPNAADFRFNLGKLLERKGGAAEALAELRRAVELRPNWAEAHNSLGSVLASQRMFVEAESAFRRALELRPAFAEALCNLGMLLSDLNRAEEADAALRQSLRIDPRFAGASEAFASLLKRTGRTEEAIQAFRRSLELSPDNGSTLSTLGGLLAEARRFDEAEPLLRRALELNPRLPVVCSNLGNLLKETGRIEQAETFYRRALAIDPDQWTVLYNFGLFLKDVRRLDEGETVARRVIELNPGLAAGYVGLGNVLLAKNSGNIDEALNCFRRAIAIDPDCQIAHSNLAYALTFVSEDGYDVLEEARRFAVHFEAPFASRNVEYHNDFTPSRRLRIGYVSPDFRDHCQSLFTLPLLRNHDHDAVEIFCYSSVEKRDSVTDEISELSDVWRDVHGLDDERLAQLITDDRIDILVDLTMHMSRARPQLFARRPAPVQVAWLAYPGTTGSTAIDYRLTDPWLDPIDSDGDDRYSEKSIRLSDTFWCYAPLNDKHVVNALPADEKGNITFGCLNNPCKLTDRTFELWAQVMRRVPDSTLMLLLAWGEAREAVVGKFEALGIDASRLNFVDYRPRDRYMDTYHEIDIVLDTFPYNGHTTSLDALWMGVPVVTVIGETPVSRAGYSLLSNLGLPELAASSDMEFVENAVALAKDLPRLRVVRSSLRERMIRSPLMDGALFAANMEQALGRIWLDASRVHRAPPCMVKLEKRNDNIASVTRGAHAEQSSGVAEAHAE